MKISQNFVAVSEYMNFTFEIFQSIVVQGGSVMYKDHTDQPPQVKRRRSQEKEVPSIPTSSPLKIMKTEPPMSPDNIVVSPGSSSTTDNSSVYHFANSIRFTQFYPEKWLKMTTARLGDIGPPHMTVTADKGKNLFHYNMERKKLCTARSIEIVPRGGPPLWLMGSLSRWEFCPKFFSN